MTTTTQATPAVTITDMHRETAHSYLSGSREGISAVVRHANGTYHVSRLDGETAWTVDASFGPGSFPHWCNGYGARYLMTREIGSASVIAELDRMAAELA